MTTSQVLGLIADICFVMNLSYPERRAVGLVCMFISAFLWAAT